MIKQTWDINKDERNRILNLHESATKNLYLINEQLISKNINNTPVQKTFPTQNIGNNFGFGEYDSEKVKNVILSLKPKIEEFIKNSGGGQFVVNISSGESNVTNPKGFETKGSLGLARANSVKKYFDEIFPDLIKKNVLTINTPKSESDVKIGSTPYDKTKGDNRNPDLIKKYRQEQFVTFDIKGGGTKCNFNLGINAGQGDPKLNYVLTDEFLNGKGEMVFTPGQIPDRLIITTNDGNIETDTGYITSEVSKYKDWKYTPLSVFFLTKLKINNSVAVSGSKILTITVTDYNDLVRQLLNNSNSIQYQKSGDEIGPPLLKMKRMIEQGQTEFVIYNLSNKGITIPFDSPSGDKKVKVFSPIGTDKIKTGYGLIGRCIS
jgi:hypothetical protein